MQYWVWVILDNYLIKKFKILLKMKLEIIQPNSHDLQRDHNIKFALCDHVLYYTVNNKKKKINSRGEGDFVGKQQSNLHATYLIVAS